MKQKKSKNKLRTLQVSVFIIKFALSMNKGAVPERRHKMILAMMYLKNFKSTVSGEYWNDVKDVSNYGFDRRELFERLSFEDAAKTVGMSLDDFEQYVKDNCIADRDLFEFSVFAHNSVLIKERGLYTEGYDKVAKKMVRSYYDVYITKNTYLSVAVNRHLADWTVRRFPFLGSEMFTKTDYKFPESIRKAWPMKFADSIGNAVHGLDIECDSITVEDFVNIHMREDYVNVKVTKPNFSCYATGSIFIPTGTGEHHTLYLTYTDLTNKDWKAVEERTVFSIPNGTDKYGKPIRFDGKQKDAPYFNSPVVEEVRKQFLQ